MITNLTNFSHYTIKSLIYESPYSLVFRGTRKGDLQAVILKVLKNTELHSQQIGEYQREYKILSNLNLPGVIQVYGLETEKQYLILVLEDCGAFPLSHFNYRGKLTLPKFITLALKIVESVTQIHQSQVIHKNLNPHNIIYNPQSQVLKLIDFGVATMPNQDYLEYQKIHILEGNLLYISPEQTGRINRYIDYRSDLYSLGITFYELLTGDLPFQTRDALELIHNHLAKKPLSPQEIKPDIPDIIDQIVMKLIAKNPRDRYQSIQGLKADLDCCLEQLNQTGLIDSFVLGKADLTTVNYARSQDILSESSSDYLVNQIIKREFPFNLSCEFNPDINSLDLNSIIKVFQTLSSEIKLDTLIAKIMSILIENAGAEKGYLLLPEQDIDHKKRWIIKAEGEIKQDKIEILQNLELTEISGNFLPKTIFDYVINTQQPVILSYATKVGDFTEDIYIKIQQPKSILCTPIINQGKLLGVLYLENHLISKAFTKKRLDIIKIFATQAAIALENAHLYKQLEDYSQNLEIKVRERTKALEKEIKERQLLENKIQSSEAEVRSFFDAMSDLVLIIDNLGENIQVAPTNVNYFYPPDIDIVGATIEQFYQSETQNTFFYYVRKAINTRQLVNFEYSLDIQEYHFDFVASIAPKNEHFVVWVARDITERKKAEQKLSNSEERFRTLVSNLPGAVYRCQVDQYWTMEFISEAIFDLCGYPAEYFINNNVLTFESIIYPEDRENVKTLIEEAVNQKKTYILEYRIVHSNGSIHWMYEKGQGIFNTNGQVLWLDGAIFDITIRKQTEAELQRSKEVADQANQAKSTFLSNMSHELRTPLNAILGFAQILQRDQSLNSDQRENIKIINRSGEHLLELINDILDMSKIDAGMIELKETKFDLFALLNTVEEMFELKAKTQGIKLIFDCANNIPQYIETDQKKLRQILINFLSNAVKFTEEGGVALRVKLVEDYRLQLYFEIEDTGVGIAPEDIDNIFEPFVQTTSGHKIQEGTGLGLPISKKFLELMGGEVGVESEFGVGTKIKFKIPIKLAEAELINQEVTKQRIIGLAPDQPQYRILIVEDRVTNRKLLIKLLQSIGFLVKEATNGQDAIAIWENWSPHLILMDLRMPIMDGYEATKIIKSHLKGQATVIIALTASAFGEEKNIILSVGCDDFLGKPFRENILLEKIAQHLGLRYIYDSDQIIETDFKEERHHNLNPDDLKVMSNQWLLELYQAANQADDQLILDILSQIPLENESLAIALTDLVKNFRFDQIINLTQIES
jgi:PAS domain S-box-containing protein